MEAAAARSVDPTPISNVNHVTARGIEGTVDGQRARLGSYGFTEELIPICFRNRVKEVLSTVQHQGHVAVVIAMGEQAAVLIMADAVRPGAAHLVQELHSLNIKPVRMLTGDNRLTAARVAESLHLDAFDAELLPQDKLDAVAKMKETGVKVAVIGDGVNDAPALAAADVAVGIGTIGTAAALESSDVVLLSDNLGAIPWAIRLSRRARRTVKLNMIFAVSVIVVMALATLGGSLLGWRVPLSTGVLAHEGGTLLVVLNSLLLLGYPRPASPESGGRLGKTEPPTSFEIKPAAIAPHG
jgi:Cd2+/Zn2+-exporting ATPase